MPDSSLAHAEKQPDGPPDPEVGIGLQKLLINAVEHGNLGRSYQHKPDLLPLPATRPDRGRQRNFRMNAVI